MKKVITNRRFSTQQKYADTISQIKVQCSTCGRKEIIPVQVDKRICTHCGRVIKNNTKLYFNYKLRNILKKGME